MKYFLSILLSAIIFTSLGIFLNQKFNLNFNFNNDLISPFISTENKEKQLPLLKYSIGNLKNYDYQASKINVIKLTKSEDAFNSYVFSFQTMGKTMSGQLNIPTDTDIKNKEYPVIILIRGYVEPEQYYSGLGTSSAAEFFAKNGYITLSPDFFGYGESEAEPSDSFEARFLKPINVIELLKTIRENPEITLEAKTYNLDQTKIGFWAHSNGGQIALSVLEILSEPIPTTLWAPVTAPFPYSILFFSDETEDEGKASRLMVSQFEKDYDSFEFSVTQHLENLAGPLQLHHGTADEAALKTWSDEFMEKIELENKKEAREKPIEIEYYSYPGADHNLTPNWNSAIQRDLIFFSKSFSSVKKDQ